MEGSKASLDERRQSDEEDDDMDRHEHGSRHGSRHNTQTSIKSSGKGKKKKQQREEEDKEKEEKKGEVKEEEDTRKGTPDGQEEEGKKEEEQEVTKIEQEGDRDEDAEGTKNQDDEEGEREREEGEEEGEGQEGVTKTHSDEEGAEWEEPKELSPEEFNSQDFLDSVNDLGNKLHADNFRTIDEDFPAEELSKMVRSVTATLGNFKTYSMHSQAQLEGLREQLKDIKDRMLKKIQLRPYDSKSANQRMSLEERELEAKIAQLNRELAKANEDVARASVTTIETETAAVEATRVAEQAAENARQIQAEYEARRKADQEARQAEEERRKLEEERKEEEMHRIEEERTTEENRRKRLVKHPDQDAKVAPDWEKWPTFTYRVNANDFDQGVGCIVRGNPNNFRENQLQCEKLSQLETTFTPVDGEEVVGNIVTIAPSSEGEQLQAPVIVVMPHCTSRASAMSREPVIKAETEEGTWTELSSIEVTLEGYKDLKFVQAEVSKFMNLVVVTRFKRDFLHMGKKGGRVISSSDSRVTFTIEKGTFTTKENFVLQLQPVDSGTLKEISLKKAEGKGLLTSSSIVSMEWTSKEFSSPITMTLPCPPNPVKAKKAAAIRAAKEAKMKNPAPPPMPMMTDDDTKDRRRKKKEVRITTDDDDNVHKPTKWYMGQYGNNDDDENDQLFFAKKYNNGRWVVLEHMSILQIKLDIVQLLLREPIARFMVLRTRTNVDCKDAQVMAEIIEQHLSERTVHTIVKQKVDDQSDVILQVTPAIKSNRVLRQLEDEGYFEGPSPSGDVRLKEGDILDVTFRGNVECPDKELALELPFNSNMKNSFSFPISVVDKFLQKSYSVYRGFVQITKRVRTVRRPNKDEMEEGISGPVVEVTNEMVSEHLVNIPKQDPEQEMEQQMAASPNRKAPVILKSHSDPVNTDTLHHLAMEMKEEWQMVAHHLNVKRMRIQAIMLDNHYNDNADEAVKYDMLLSWAKKVPRGFNKVEILKNALVQSGRPDLARELLDLNEGFQSRRDHDEHETPQQEVEAQ